MWIQTQNNPGGGLAEDAAAAEAAARLAAMARQGADEIANEDGVRDGAAAAAPGERAARVPVMATPTRGGQGGVQQRPPKLYEN